MSTAAVRCPFCGAWMRVAVQESRVEKTDEGSLLVMFDAQKVAHICRERDETNGGGS